ncbi:MAG TPA: amidohydrolase family protein [Sphingomicrobium sp.]|nr:amidohydrolase family protein [Sphingomicrobium sp.]
MTKAIFALAALLLSGPALADTLITNINGIQSGRDGQLERFRAIVVAPDGKVRQVVENPEVANLANITSTVDGGGRTLLPGLIDAHGHVMALGFAALRLDLTGTASVTDLQQRLKDYAAANRDAKWIVGRGWNQELWPDQRFPTAADLDAVVDDRPVALERVDGHALVANSAALKAAGITAATRDPVGGKIERDARGNPTGLLIDAAMPLVERRIPAPTPADRDRALALAQRILLEHGLTAVADMGTSLEDWQAMQRAGRAKRLQVRIMSYAAGVEAMRSIRGRKDGETIPLSLVGVKIYGDGALGSRGAWLKRPYADQPDTRGLQFLTDAQLQAQVNEAAAAGLQPAVHAIGDAAVEQAIRIFETAGARFGRDRRWRIEHFQIADPADIPRLAPAGIIASMQPVHQTSDRLMAEKRLSPDRLAGAYAWQSVLKSGARLAFGSDFPVESPNPFPGLAAAISRQDMDGQPAGGWIPSERLTFEQALRAFTREAAFAGFAEDRIGALEPGKWADFILIDRDLTKVDAQGLARARVLETWVAGRKVWQLPGVASNAGERGQ